MKRKTILKSIVIILLVVEVISLYLLSKPDNKVVLDDVLTMPLKNKRQTLAVMVQQEDNTWKEAENRNVWPSSTTHGFVGSRCYDGNGALVESTDIIQFDLSTYTATINATSSIYCTLYFAKGRPLLQVLTETKGTTLNMDAAVDGMYRYKGTATDVTNNYICFGTTDKAKCLDNPNVFMYRIIGVTNVPDNTVNIPANSLKLIKATPSSESPAWHNNNYDDTKWDDSDMKSYLNGTFYNSIKDAKPNGAYWDSIILSHSWYNADYTSVPNTEPTSSHTDTSKIGLMYATDYKNSGNWLYIKNGWSTNSTLSGNALYEWTLSRYGKNGVSTYAAWSIYSGGSLGANYLGFTYSARPVFYLQSEINLSGEGTKENPFIISGVMPQS